MNIIKWHDRLSSKIRICILIFIVLLTLDNSTFFDIQISETLTISSNLSTWLSAKVMGAGFMDGFSFELVGLHLLLMLLLFGAIREPYRNIWVLKFCTLAIFSIIFISNYQLLETTNVFAIGLNAFFQSIKIIPLFMAYRWTKQLEIPMIIS